MSWPGRRCWGTPRHWASTSPSCASCRPTRPRRNGDWSRGVILYSERGTAGTAVGIVLIGVCGILALHGSMRPELAYTFLLGIAAVPFLALHLIGASVVRAFGGVVAALAPERVVRDSLLLAIMAVAFWGNFYRLDATLAMGATLLSSTRYARPGPHLPASPASACPSATRSRRMRPETGGGQRCRSR